MKKLTIAAAIVCAAALSHAATANWEARASYIYNGTGSDAAAAKVTGTAYLFDSAVMSQADLYALLCTADFDITSQSDAKWIKDLSVSSGTISATEFAYGEQSVQGGATYSYDYYFAILGEDQAYFSNVKTVTSNAGVTPKGVNFGAQYDDYELELDPLYLPNSVKLATETYEGAGQWASTAAVPEPTSGLLFLLGVAGLALRRRRA